MSENLKIGWKCGSTLRIAINSRNVAETQLLGQIDQKGGFSRCVAIGTGFRSLDNEFGSAEMKAVPVLQQLGVDQPLVVDKSPVGAAQIPDPQMVTAFMNLRVVPGNPFGVQLQGAIVIPADDKGNRFDGHHPVPGLPAFLGCGLQMPADLLFHLIGFRVHDRIPFCTAKDKQAKAAGTGRQKRPDPSYYLARAFTSAMA